MNRDLDRELRNMKPQLRDAERTVAYAYIRVEEAEENLANLQSKESELESLIDKRDNDEN